MQLEGQSTARRVIAALRIYACLIVAVLALSWHVYLTHPTFDRRPLFGQTDQFRDLLNYVEKTAHLRHSAATLGKGFPTFAYSPPAAYLWHALFIIPGHPLRPYLVLVVAAVLIFAIVGMIGCRGTGLPKNAAVDAIAVTALLGWPAWYAADRGNLEGLAWALSGAAMCCFLRQRYRWAAVFIGLAACIKPFPLALCALLALRSKYREVALACGITGALVLAACTAIGPTPWEVLHDLKPGFAYYKQVYIQSIRPFDEIRMSHSILDVSKLAAVVWKARTAEPTTLYPAISRLGGNDEIWNDRNRFVWRGSRLLATFYPLVACAVFALMVFWARGKPALNQITIFGIGAALLPPNAFEYTLLNLYVPFGALVIFLVREVAKDRASLSRAALFTLIVLYVLLFTPLTFLRIYAGSAKLLVLLLLLAIFVRIPMPAEYFGDPVETPLYLESAAV